MRILVTGGMGEVGRPTVEWLLSHGHEVRVLDLAIARGWDLRAVRPLVPVRGGDWRWPRLFCRRPVW